jgi:UbiD family decarboxylase
VRFSSLEDYVEAVGKHEQVLTLPNVKLDVEIGSIAELLAERSGPLLLCTDLPGADQRYRVAVNVMHTAPRFALAMGIDPASHPLDIVRGWRSLVRSPLIDPVPADGSRLYSGASRQSDDLSDLPKPRWHEKDGGAYIGTGDMVVIKDPDSDWVNVGTYRCAVVDDNRLTLWIIGSKQGRMLAQKYWSAGKRAPVAIVLGADPVTWHAASASVPAGISEYAYAGALHGAPVEVVPSSLHGLPVPASSEIVVEGEYASPEDDGAPEGPFGEWPGYYAHQGIEGVVHVKRVVSAERAILHGEPPYRPLAAIRPVPTFAAALWDQIERSGVDGIAGVWGFCHTLMIVVSVRQRFPGHAKQALLSALGNRQKSSMYCYYVAVDDDVDPSDLEEVVWAMCTRVDPVTDVDIIRSVWTGGIDPRLAARPPGAADGVMADRRLPAVRVAGPVPGDQQGGRGPPGRGVRQVERRPRAFRRHEMSS